MATESSLEPFELPTWTWDFHGHRYLFMSVGYRMGRLAMKELNVEKVKDRHGDDFLK